MAIQIIPKEAAKLPLWQNILLYISVALVLVCILGYFVLNYFAKKSDLALQDLEKTLTEAKTPQKIVLKEEILDYQEKIEDFSSLLVAHKRSSNFFDFLEKNTHPRVFFSKLRLDTKVNRVELSGQAENFQILGQQLLIFRKAQEEKFIQNLNLPGFEIGEEGKIEFTFGFLLNPKLFQF